MIKKILLPFLFVMLFILTPKAYAYSAKSYCVIEQNSKRILASSNEKVRMGMASTTKIMTAFVAVMHSNPNDVVTVSRKASYTEGSSLYLKEGETIKMSDLIYGLMLNSGNDSAVAIAEHISGSCEEFSKLMTQTAHEIGASDTNFVNPNGLSDDNHYTTAYDLALITSKALENEEFAKIVSTKKYIGHTLNTNRALYFTNHNKLLSSINGCVGVKTGFTKATGRCLVSSVEKNGWQAVCVTLDAPDDWNDHKQLFDYVFEKYSIRKIIDKNSILKTVDLNGSEEGGNLEIACSEDVSVVMSDDDNVRINLDENLNEIEPIKKNDSVGNVQFFLNDQLIDIKKAVAYNDVVFPKKRMFGFEIKKLFSKWLSLGR